MFLSSQRTNVKTKPMRTDRTAGPQASEEEILETTGNVSGEESLTGMREREY